MSSFELGATASNKQAPIPPAFTLSFNGAIAHPDLMLWDSWTYTHAGVWHLYCLALAKRDHEGNPILPHERNDYQFHIRHFDSDDQGATWRDRGCFLKLADIAGAFARRNVWSGSVLPLADGRVLMGFTGIAEMGNERPFVQSIGIAVSRNGADIDHVQNTPLSCPLRDYGEITGLGYYLGPKENLGHKDGEDGGPILAWRDPYLLQNQDGSIDAFWSAKVSPREGAIAHARLIETPEGFEVEKLYPPITLPDSDLFTQAEVPKIYFDSHSDQYLCLLAACDRLYEGQDDAEVQKLTRLYIAPSVRGPWVPWTPGDSKVTDMENLFGCSVVDAAYSSRELVLIAPYTEMADKDHELTFAPAKTITYG